MSLILFDSAFTFDPNSSTNSQNFLRYLDQAGSPYTVFSSTAAQWIVQVTTPGLGFTYVAFFPADTFVPAPGGSTAPPAGVVDAVGVYNSSGTLIASFDFLGELDAWVEDFINDPSLIVLGDDDFGGSDFVDILHAGEGSDLMFGLDGADQLFGDAGDDFIEGGEGNDAIDGGDGVDEAFYDNAAAGVTVSLAAAGAQNTGGAGIDTLVSIENLYGSAFADQLTGDGGVNTLSGGAGSDVLDGGLGTDTISAYADIAAVTIHLAGGWGQDAWGAFDTLSNFENITGSSFHDTLVGNSIANSIAGGAGDDWMVGLEGDDVLEGGAGVNVLIGGDGTDLASYASATTGLWVNMAAGVYSATGVWDVFFESIEGVLGGSGNDSIFGNTSDNTLRGGAGNDALIGNAGNDRLEGGEGQDWIVGGDGNDRLIGGVNDVDVLTAGAGADIFDLGANAGWDVAFDFNVNEDRFQIGGHVWSGFLTIDADGDGSADDTLLGYAGGNFVALNVSGLSLEQWNALVDAPSGASEGEKLLSDPEPQTLPALADTDLSREMLAGLFPEHGFDLGPEAFRGFTPQNPLVLPQDEWGATG